jgi:hypothetical protein
MQSALWRGCTCNTSVTTAIAGDDPNYWMALTHQAEAQEFAVKVQNLLAELNKQNSKKVGWCMNVFCADIVIPISCTAADCRDCYCSLKCFISGLSSSLLQGYAALGVMCGLAGPSGLAFATAAGDSAGGAAWRWQ